MVRTVAGSNLQREMAAAIDPALRAISASLGPDGRSVLYAAGNNVLTARSGSEIARHICSDHFAARLLKETLVAAERELGDGTARLAVMTGAALREGRRAVAAGVEPQTLLLALEGLRPELDVAFSSDARPADDLRAVLQGAGATGELAGQILAAHSALGDAGLIEPSSGPEAGITIYRGFTLEAKAATKDVVSALQNVHLLVANEILDDFKALTPVIEGFASSNKSLVIAARGLTGLALELIERNRRARVLRVAAVLPGDAGPRAAELLEDLAAATGATMIGGLLGTRLESLRPDMLGRAESFQHQNGRAVLEGCAGDPAQINVRLSEIEAEIRAKTYLPLDLEHAQRRRARLLGQWADLSVAGEDGAVETAKRAIAALRSSQAGGVIDGAGRGLDRIADRLAAVYAGGEASGAARTMVVAALRAPGRSLRRNAMCGETQTLPVGQDVTDPASLSRNLIEVALSLAARLAGLQGAIQQA